MNTFDYILDSALVLIVLIQLRERQMSMRPLIRPIVILAIAVANYLHGFPTQGNDLLLLAVFAVIGGTIGILSGITVIMRRGEEGKVMFRSGPESAFFWVLGMGSRFAFIYWITHSGSASIARFSFHHSISGANAWTVALLGMAVFEVLSRTGIMAYRWRQLEPTTNIALA
jgi:hypothetical protein